MESTYQLRPGTAFSKNRCRARFQGNPKDRCLDRVANSGTPSGWHPPEPSSPTGSRFPAMAGAAPLPFLTAGPFSKHRYFVPRLSDAPGPNR
jgi:hypothetical protein